MPRYVDGFLLPLPRRNLAAYRRLSAKAGRFWMEFGALAYVECVGDDLDAHGMAPFGRAARCRKGETVVFSFIIYRSRSQRDRINARIQADPRLKAMMEGLGMPFDVRRMAYGGFRAIVDLPKGA